MNVYGMDDEEDLAILKQGLQIDVEIWEWGTVGMN